MVIGIEIIGGGNHKFTRTSVNVEGEGSKGITTKDSINNEFTDVQVFVKDTKEKFKELQNIVSNIQDDSINYVTQNQYRDDVLNKLPALINSNNEDILKRDVLDLLTLLSSWITIKIELSAQLKPYADYLILLIGG